MQIYFAIGLVNRAIFIIVVLPGSNTATIASIILCCRPIFSKKGLTTKEYQVILM